MGRNGHLTYFRYLKFRYPAEAQKVILSGEKVAPSADTFFASCDIVSFIFL